MLTRNARVSIGAGTGGLRDIADVPSSLLRTGLQPSKQRVIAQNLYHFLVIHEPHFPYPRQSGGLDEVRQRTPLGDCRLTPLLVHVMPQRPATRIRVFATLALPSWSTKTDGASQLPVFVVKCWPVRSRSNRLLKATLVSELPPESL